MDSTAEDIARDNSSFFKMGKTSYIPASLS